MTLQNSNEYSLKEYFTFSSLAIFSEKDYLGDVYTYTDFL